MRNAFASQAAQMYEIMDADQTKEFLQISGVIRPGQDVIDFLKKMPEDARTLVLEKSPKLTLLWQRRVK
ncbi:MAG: hypothetical protein MI861_01980 [Pirellulales bacterium]|nr:hypothetical protein [Pirellulales bacterium]